MIQLVLRQLLPACHPLLVPRDGAWWRVSRQYLEFFPRCVVCGKRKGVVPHHIKPVHKFPELELMLGNLMTLCPRDHLLFGHLGSWSSWNEEVLLDCANMRLRIEKRP